MAIHPPTPPSAQAVAAAAAIDIEAWTEQATQALSAVAISAPAPGLIRGTAVTLDIPLDEHEREHEHPARRPPPARGANTDAPAGQAARRREPPRRDSLRRREALLKGKEGSRRRQRWENGGCPLPLPLSPPPSDAPARPRR